MTALGALDSARLTDAERVIEHGLGTFVQVGRALANIRDQRLYRATHDTFEAYCSQRWGFTDRRARQMIDAAATTDALPTGTTVPVNEGQARALSGLAPDVAAQVMAAAEEVSDGKPTAEAIRQARAHVTQTTRVSEATKVEHDVDTATGEILTDEPGQVTKLTGHNSVSDPSDSPSAVASHAMRDARNSPWQVFSVKLLGSLVQWGDWLHRDSIGGPEGLIRDLNAQPYAMPEADESVLRTLAEAKAWITDIEKALTERGRQHLRSVK